MKKFDFHPGYYHICQLSADKGIIFYSTADYLVYYTTVSVKCLKEGIKPIAFSIMVNHDHLEAPFKTAQQMISFRHDTTTSFARVYNYHYGLKGPVFNHGFERSAKYSDKYIRDTFVYIGNNGKEKIPGIRAEQYKWNILQFLVSSHPFSEEIDFRKASSYLLRLLAGVLKRREKLQPLDYEFFGDEYQKLSEKERLQLTDFIINAYFFLDKEKILSLYGSYENVLTAMNAVSGAEYEFKDDSAKEDYRNYYKMMSVCERMGIDIPKLRAFSYPNLSKSQKFRDILISNFEFQKLVRQIQLEIRASEYELSKFFHLL